MKLSDNILFIIVSCARESARLKVLQQIVVNFNYNFTREYDIQDSLLVFDNGSTEETVELLKNNFRNVYRSEINVGYWTALDWSLRNSERILNKKFKYVHIMEADHLYHSVYKFDWCIDLLDEREDIGSIKCHEYFVQLRHLYDKGNPNPKTRKHDWISHHNRWLGKDVSWSKIEGHHDHFYLSNFITQLHNLTRAELMIKCFDELKKMEKFNEGDFHRLYCGLNPNVAILNGGLFNMKLGFNEGIPGSSHGWNEQIEKEFKKHGYVQTNVDRILEDSSYNVERV